MARIVSLGSALQDIYLIDHDDLAPTTIGSDAIFGNVLVGTKVDIDSLSYEVGGGGINSAITFSRHGHEAIFIGNIAHDSAGEAISAISHMILPVKRLCVCSTVKKSIIPM